MSWERAREIMGDERVLLGPQASYQWRHDPKHLLFVLARYKHAARLIGGSALVLEVGCGEGIGAPILGDRRLYVGIDPDADAIDAAARQLWPDDPTIVTRFHLEVTDLDGYRCEVKHDAVVALDVIEHVAEGARAAFMRKLAADLPPYGVCVIGTPNATAAAYQSPASRAGHVSLLGADELAALLGERFWLVQLFGMNDEVLHTGFLPMAHYLLGVGIGPR